MLSLIPPTNSWICHHFEWLLEQAKSNLSDYQINLLWHILEYNLCAHIWILWAGGTSQCISIADSLTCLSSNWSLWHRLKVRLRVGRKKKSNRHDHLCPKLPMDMIDIINISTLTLAQTCRFKPSQSQNLTNDHLPPSSGLWIFWLVSNVSNNVCQLKGVPGTMVLHSSFSIVTMLYTTLAHPEVFDPLTLSTSSIRRWLILQVCFYDFATLKAKQHIYLCYSV